MPDSTQTQAVRWCLDAKVLLSGRGVILCNPYLQSVLASRVHEFGRYEFNLANTLPGSVHVMSLQYLLGSGLLYWTWCSLLRYTMPAWFPSLHPSWRHVS